MTPPEEQHAAAILALLNAGNAAAYEIDKIKGFGANLPPQYNEVTLSWRFGGLLRLSARPGNDGYRFTTRAVARLLVSARRVQQAADDALTGKRLMIAGQLSSPIQRESRDAFAEDSGWYSALTTWTYVI